MEEDLSNSGEINIERSNSEKIQQSTLKSQITSASK